MNDTVSTMNLGEVVPRETLDRLAAVFRAATAVPIVFTDPDGVPLTPVEDPLCFCSSLVRQEGTLCLRRKRWDIPEERVEKAILLQHTGGQPIQHRCLGGFADAAVPVVVEGRNIGYAVFARSRTEKPDPEEFRRLAQRGGMEPEVGDQVAAHTLVMSPEQIRTVAELLQVITGLVATAAYDTLRARRIMELERLRDDLTHMIVHDLRTPLTAIIGGLQTIEQTDYEPEMVHEFVPISLSSAEALLEMVNTLLDISKMESGEMTLSREEVSFGKIAQAAVDQVRGLARERNHRLEVDVSAAQEPILADPEKLRRTATNLVGNALKFTPDGGLIRLTATCDESGLTFSVSDSGPGIAPQYHARIFEKFGQVEERKAGRKNSTGLGLTFCKMVAEAHGGRIWVESEVGKGSKFSVFIPREA